MGRWRVTKRKIGTETKKTRKERSTVSDLLNNEEIIEPEIETTQKK